MESVDGSDHYSKTTDGSSDPPSPPLHPTNPSPEPPPSLLTIILDTNLNAWALLHSTLPLSTTLANLLVFINAHLAINHANRIAIIASHTLHAEFLYPSSNPLPQATTSAHDDANKYRPFRLIQETLLTSLTHLLSTTSPHSLPNNPTTAIAGALTLALTHINKTTLSLSPTPTANQTTANPDTPSKPVLTSRILILSVSGDLAAQYIPIMNCIFAAQRLSIPIDICKIAGDTVFLQQASDATRGVYMKLEHPRGLLQYLMMAFLPDASSRKHLVAPTAVGVDFRAACFCHRRVVDVGFVCSICLSSKSSHLIYLALGKMNEQGSNHLFHLVFCSPPEGAICLTCGTHLQLGQYGGKPAVMRKKKKKRNRIDGEVRLSTGTPGP